MQTSPVYIGIYVDDIIYFSPSDAVEKKFEELLGSVVQADFMGQVSYFLGIEFQWKHHTDGHVTAILTQESFADSLIESLGFEFASSSTFLTPYRSGLPIDSVQHDDMPSAARDKLRLQYQSLVGSLYWLVHTTRPDLSTVVSLLAQHQANPSYGHYESACYKVKYLANTKHLGIYFSSRRSSTLKSFLHFPLSNSFLAMSDANWGPKDASLSKLNFDLPLCASRFMSAFYIDLLGPLHWVSKQQTITAGSLAEAEIYATDECVKFLFELVQILDFLEVKDMFMPNTNVIYKDNQACVDWAKSCTSKGLRHIQMKENRVRENVVTQFVSIKHVDGKVNITDIFTKEMKDVNHFVALHDLFMCSRYAT